MSNKNINESSKIKEQKMATYDVTINKVKVWVVAMITGDNW